MASAPTATDGPTTYRHVVITGHGGPEMLAMVQDPLPEPQAGEVRVRLTVAVAAFTDVLIREGLYPGIPKPPFSPGYAGVGVVDALGAGVTDLALGQRVAALTVVGTYSEVICRPASEWVPLPEGVDAGEAVCLVLQYLTTHQLLHRVAQVQPGQRVLIHGAAGGVGTALLTLGRRLNLEMYGTASAAKHDQVRQLGGIPIDYRHEDFVARLQALPERGVDAVFDGIGGTHLLDSRRVLRPGGRLVAYGFSAALQASPRWLALATTFALIGALKLWPDLRSLSFYTITGMKQAHPDWFRADLTALLQQFQVGEIHPVIAQRLPLSQAAEAHRLLDRAAVPGQLVLMCDREADLRESDLIGV